MDKDISIVIKEERNRYIKLTGKIPDTVYLTAKQIEELIDYIKYCEFCAKIEGSKHTEKHLKKCLKEHNFKNKLTIYGMAVEEVVGDNEIRFE